MSTQAPVTLPSIPLPTGEIVGNSASVLAIKMTLETQQGSRGVVRASTLHGPTASDIAISAVLRHINAS